MGILHLDRQNSKDVLKFSLVTYTPL